MKLTSHLKKIEANLTGRIISKNEFEFLIQNFSLAFFPKWFINILSEFKLTESSFFLDDEYDKSGLGVSFLWLTPAQIVDEAFNAYPGKQVLYLNYIPIGGCLRGSGDPYFLRIKEELNDFSLVRIPHDLSVSDIFPESEIEVVCDSLSYFFQFSEIY